jgi:hypothetical protein
LPEEGAGDLSGKDRRTIDAWLVYCADPVRPLNPRPRRMPPAEIGGALVERAHVHGILPAVARNFGALSDDPAFAAAHAEAKARLRQARALTMMLRSEGKDLLAAAAGLPVAMVKGELFASTIYPDAALRPYSDIDLLARPVAIAPLGELLASRGFELVNAGDAAEEKEWKWVHRDNPVLMVEVHTDLMQAKLLKRQLSLTFNDLDGDTAAPASCLMVAVMHGAYSHHFASLRHIVDICQAARAIVTVEEERRFEALVKRLGARLVVAAGLDLTARTMGDRRCREMQRGLGFWPRAAAKVAGRSLAPPGSLPFRLSSWRRKALRELMRWSGH